MGTGAGRVALQIAPHVRRVVAIDKDAYALDAARAAARRMGLPNVEFVEADAEAVDLSSFNENHPFLLATSRLFFSKPLVARLGPAVGPGGHLVLEALEGDHWREAGGSPFALPSSEILAALAEHGFRVEDVRVEQTIHDLPDADAARELLKTRRLWAKWRADGRWETLKGSLRGGQRTLTDSHLVARLRRASA